MLIRTSGHGKPYNSQSIGQEKCELLEDDVTVVTGHIKLSRAHRRKTFPQFSLTVSNYISMDMWGLYTVLFLSVLLPGKSW